MTPSQEQQQEKDREIQLDKASYWERVRRLSKEVKKA